MHQRIRRVRRQVRGYLRPSCAIAVDGSLFPDSFCARRMLLTAVKGQKPTSAKAQSKTGRDITLE